MKTLRVQVGVRILSEAVLALRGLFLIPALATTLGAEGYGAFAQVWLTAQLLTPFISLATENAVVQRVAGTGSGGARSADVLVNALLISTMLGGLVIALGLTPAGHNLAEAALGDGPLHLEFMGALILAATGAPIAIGLGYLQGQQRIEAASALYVSRAFMSALVMIAVALGGFGLRAVLLSAIATELVFVGVLLAAARPEWRTAAVSTRELRWIATFSLPFAAGHALYLALNALPRYVLVHADGLAVVAGFSATLSLATPLVLVGGSLQYVIYPAAVRVAQRERIGQENQLVGRSAVAFLCFASFALVGLSALGAPILAFLSGGRFSASTTEFATVGYGMVCLGLYRVLVVQLLTGGDSKALLAPLATSALVVAAASALLVPRASSAGAALAFLLGCAALLIHTLVQFGPALRVLTQGAGRALLVRGAVALLVPVAGLLVWPAADLRSACIETAVGVAAVAAAWTMFGGAPPQEPGVG